MCPWILRPLDWWINPFSSNNKNNRAVCHVWQRLAPLEDESGPLFSASSKLSWPWLCSVHSSGLDVEVLMAHKTSPKNISNFFLTILDLIPDPEWHGSCALKFLIWYGISHQSGKQHLADVESQKRCGSQAFPLFSDLSESEGSALTLSNTHLQYLKNKRWVSVGCVSLFLEFVALPYSTKCRASDRKEQRTFTC